MWNPDVAALRTEVAVTLVSDSFEIRATQNGIKEEALRAGCVDGHPHLVTLCVVDARKPLLRTHREAGETAAKIRDGVGEISGGQCEATIRQTDPLGCMAFWISQTDPLGCMAFWISHVHAWNRILQATEQRAVYWQLTTFEVMLEVDFVFGAVRSI